MRPMRVYVDTSVYGGAVNNTGTGKRFDCVEMKRRIQEKIHQETCEMSSEELLAYFRQRIAESRFAWFLDNAPQPAARARADEG